MAQAVQIEMELMQQEQFEADLKEIFNANRIRDIEELCLPESARRDYVNTSGGQTPLSKK